MSGVGLLDSSRIIRESLLLAGLVLSQCTTVLMEEELPVILWTGVDEVFDL